MKKGERRKKKRKKKEGKTEGEKRRKGEKIKKIKIERGLGGSEEKDKCELKISNSKQMHLHKDVQLQVIVK